MIKRIVKKILRKIKRIILKIYYKVFYKGKSLLDKVIFFIKPLFEKKKNTRKHLFLFYSMGVPVDVLSKKSKIPVKKIEELLEEERRLHKVDDRYFKALKSWKISEDAHIESIYNNVYSIEDKWVMKLTNNEWLTRKDIAIATSLKDALPDYQVPTYVENREGQVISASSVLMEKLSGEMGLAMWNSGDRCQMMQDVGKLLARFHQEATGVVSEETAPIMKLTDEKNFILPALLLYRPSLYRNAKNNYKKLEEAYKDGQFVVSHGDFHFGNIMFKDGKICGLLDFVESKRESPLYDISYFIIESFLFFDNCSEESNDDEFLSLVRIFFREYCRINPLSDKEKQFLPLFIDAICIRFITFFCFENVSPIRDLCIEAKRYFADQKDEIMKLCL